MDVIGDVDLGGFPMGFRAFDTLSARGLGGGMSGGMGAWEPPVDFITPGSAYLPDETAVDAAPALDAFLAAFVAPEEFASTVAHNVSPQVDSAPSAMTEAALFTNFDWPEQTRFALDNDDAFLAPVRGAGRALFSWL